ncbi:MAG: diguanylate cyclase [Alteromonadaceae bacterium]|nr:diguanylate cyclase [Alteromonadaceae bacterium]MBH84720.1 diguanylate cyclase [Alteromonadaceae bacterium]
MFQRIQHWFDSLRNRAVGIVVLFVVLITVIATLVGIFAGQREIESQTRAQLETDAAIIAENIDDKLEQRFRAISSVAHSMTMDRESLLGRAQLMLNRQVALGGLFHRLYLMDENGKVAAAFPAAEDALGIDVSDRPYFKLTSQQLTTLISEPFLTRDENEPVVIVTAPVFDFKQRMIAILAGTIKLDEDSFLGQLGTVSIGKDGEVGVATRSGKVLAGSGASNKLEPLPPGNHAFDDARKGGEGVRIARATTGEKILVANRQLNSAPWFVGVSLPVNEAFAPIDRLVKVMFWVGLALIVLFVPLALHRFTRLLRPLDRLARQIPERALGELSGPVKVGGGREIQTLVGAFNEVMEERDRVKGDLEQQEVYYRALSERAPIGIVQTDVLGRVEFVNAAFESIMGQPAQKLRNRHMAGGVYRDDRPEVMRTWRKVLREGGVSSKEYRLFDASANRVIWVSAMTSAIATPDRSLGTLTIINDITEQRAVEAELKAERNRATSILGVLQEGVILTDSAGVISYANGPAHAFLGQTETVSSLKLFDLMSVTIGDQPWTLDEFLQQPQVNSLDAVMTNVNETEFEVELTMLRLDRDEETDRLVFVLRDDSERRRQEAALTWEASHDSLTRLSNRRAFNARLSELLRQDVSRRNGSIVMLIDLDHFKPVNDNGGHLLGDEMLRQIATVLTHAVRQSDMAARLGGDEFGVILPACGLDRAEVIAESIRAGIEAITLEQEGALFSVTASIGVTDIVDSDSDYKSVVARADEGAYDAKGRGRNQVVVLSGQACPALS